MRCWRVTWMHTNVAQGLSRPPPVNARAQPTMDTALTAAPAHGRDAISAERPARNPIRDRGKRIDTDAARSPVANETQ
ncbi:unnamed protein product, partial [Iphiclides podalirius]